MIEITDFSSHIIWLGKKIDKTGGHQTSQERLFYFCAQPTRLRGFIFPPPHRSLRTLADSHCEPSFPTSTPFFMNTSRLTL